MQKFTQQNFNFKTFKGFPKFCSKKIYYKQKFLMAEIHRRKIYRLKVFIFEQVSMEIGWAALYAMHISRVYVCTARTTLFNLSASSWGSFACSIGNALLIFDSRTLTCFKYYFKLRISEYRNSILSRIGNFDKKIKKIEQNLSKFGFIFNGF